jgi:Arylsulfotransferase (ASST)
VGFGLTRRRFLRALGAGAFLAPANACGLLGRTPKLMAPREPETSPLWAPKVWPLPGVTPLQPKGVWAFRSRQDLAPAAAEVTGGASGMAPGYVFLALKEGAGEHGPMILDNRGQLVWFGKYISARDFKVQRYRGRPVLTWWEGSVVVGHGVGEYVIFDDSYHEISRVSAGDGLRGDLHEFHITPEDTALLTAYAEVPADLSPAGGPVYGAAWDGIAQEVDIESGEVLFEWHSLDHVGLEESYVAPPEDPAYGHDYFHINSIDVDYDGNLIVSARKPVPSIKSTARAAGFCGASAARTATSRWEKGPAPPSSTTPAATRRAPSPSSTTARTRRCTSSRERSCCASTRRR